MNEPTEAEIYARLIDALKIAEGCMTQLAHKRKDERWIMARRVFEAGREKIIALALRRAA